MTTQSNQVSKAALVVGWILTALPVLMLLMGVVMVFSKSPKVSEGFAHYGYPAAIANTLGIVELACAIIYLIPWTSFLGAILMTGYLGGAVATHLRIGEPFYIPVVVGVLVWGGLFLREPRLRALLPLRKS